MQIRPLTQSQPLIRTYVDTTNKVKQIPIKKGGKLDVRG